MQLMKKDMGGAAVTLALAQAVMALALPVRLRLLIGAVENSVSGDSFRPGDVLRTRKGLTVEIGNTDAEGRLVLADLLAEADGERPALLVDCATLTGAARVALGPDLPALFTPDDELAADLLAAGNAAFEPLWRLPLHGPYRELIDSPIADLNNAGKGGFAGAITAALFLERFVTETRSWAHLDIYAWTPENRAGRPKGGEATGLRALLHAIERRFVAAPR
jgi:leucyl aminopeptidase